MFLSSKFICSSLPFSFYLSHSICLSVTLYILTYISMLFCLNICAKPIKMTLFGWILKRNKRRERFSQSALSTTPNIFNISFHFSIAKQKSMNLNFTISNIIRDNLLSWKPKTKQKPWASKVEFERKIESWAVSFEIYVSPPYFHFASFHVNFHSVFDNIFSTTSAYWLAYYSIFKLKYWKIIRFIDYRKASNRLNSIHWLRERESVNFVLSFILFVIHLP